MFSKCLLILFCSVFIEAQFPYDHQRCPWPHLDHGRVRVRQRTKLVKFMCLPRYELVGNRYATCRAGSWDVPMPVCVKPGCDSFSVPNAVQIRAHQEAWVTTFCMPGYTLIGSAAIYCNGIKWNATIPRCAAGTTAVSLSCDFEEADLCGWMQDDLHDFDWIRLNSKTPTSFLNTGPSYDHTYGKGGKGYYMYIESTSKLENNTARLVSPVYDSKLAVNGCFSFYYHMYGQGIGGLRVYQKPDSVMMSDLLDLADTEKQQYMIFEQWGNLGDFWYSQASQLKDFKDSFQVVIEGVRGSSFTSDIAIDDVAILQGINCTYFRNAGTTPVPPQNSESCAGRCDDQLPVPNGCECSASCSERNQCCPDYIEICVFNGRNSTDLDDVSPTFVSSVEEQPQTEKLVGETTTAVTNTTTSTTTTTPVPTTIPTTETTTKTTKTTTKLTSKLTTKLTTNPTTKLTTTKLTTTKQTTTKQPTTKLTTRLISTTAVTPILPILTNSTTTDEEQKKKEEKELNVQKMTTDKLVDDSTNSSAWKTAVITIVVLAVFASIIYLGLASRTNGGRVVLARLRGRALASNDPEVRYLNSNDDDL